jgi:hypothetical protein
LTVSLENRGLTILVDVAAQQTRNLFHEENFEETYFDFVHHLPLPTIYSSARWFTRLNSSNRIPQEITLQIS